MTHIVQLLLPSGTPFRRSRPMPEDEANALAAKWRAAIREDGARIGVRVVLTPKWVTMPVESWEGDTYGT